MSHSHDSHEHDSSETSWRESQPAPGTASMLDIGGDVGAVSVRLADDTSTGEIMACERGNPSRHFHTGVHLRAVGENQEWVAVFPAVRAGEYSLLTADGNEHTPFVVVGGEVTFLALTNASSLATSAT